MRIDRATDGLAEARAPSDPDRDRGTPQRHGRGRARRNRGHSRPEHAVARLPQFAGRGVADLVETLGVTEPGYDRVEAEAAAARAELDDREWQVLRLRFVDQMTQREIGHEVGVSQMQISRISRRALGKLLTAVRGEQADDLINAAALSGLVGRDLATEHLIERAGRGQGQIGTLVEGATRSTEEADLLA